MSGLSLDCVIILKVVFCLSSRSFNLNNELWIVCIYIQGVPKKKHSFVFFLAITPFWKGLEIKVGGVLKIQEIFYQIDTKVEL